MRARHTYQDFGLPWETQWSTRRMRWAFFILGRDRATLRAIAEELAPVGYRVRSLEYYKEDHTALMVLTKLAVLSEEEMTAEIQRLNALCKSREIHGLDDVDVEDLQHDDRSVN